MSEEGSIASERQKVTERARAGSPADAAYLIGDYNRRRFIYKEERVSLQEVLPDLSQTQIEMLERKANALFADEGYFGEKHWTGRSLEEIYKEMQQRHPGFSQEAYSLALDRGIFATR
ncbi:MAG TPA: hypothetical protein VHU22_18250 [Xanthobacteraceae bacterium]|jgi:hypothetical protein|nr:hypothetical protein [Xanthobacteraceae bacterium]